MVDAQLTDMKEAVNEAMKVDSTTNGLPAPRAKYDVIDLVTARPMPVEDKPESGADVPIEVEQKPGANVLVEAEQEYGADVAAEPVPKSDALSRIRSTRSNQMLRCPH